MSRRKRFLSTIIPTIKIASKMIIGSPTINTQSTPKISLNLLDHTNSRCLNSHTQMSTNTQSQILKNKRKIKRDMSFKHLNTRNLSHSPKLLSSYRFQLNTTTNIGSSYSLKKLLSFINSTNNLIVCPFIFYLNTPHTKIKILL